MQELRLTYHIEKKDFIRINLWSAFERSQVSKILFYYGFYTLDALIFIFALLAEMPFGYFIFIILLATFPLIMWLAVVTRAKKNYAKNNFFHDHDVTMKVDDIGICESFFSREYCNTWEEIILISELKDMFIILVENIRVLYIPKSVLQGDDRASFRETAHNKMDKKKLRGLRH